MRNFSSFFFTLPSVVAGLIGFNANILGYIGSAGTYGTYKDIDNLTKNGYYDVKGLSESNGTIPYSAYGVLLNIAGVGSSGYGLQILISNNATSTATRLAVRVQVNNGWIPWTFIAS